MVALCEFCIKHGEGKKWYENMQNYSDHLFHLDGREDYVVRFLENFEAGHVRPFTMFDRLRTRMPAVYRFVRQIVHHRVKRNHFGQVVPLEDALRIVDMVDSICALPCVCRSNTLGRKEYRYCLAVGVDFTKKLGVYPDYASGLEVLSKEQARERLKKLDKQGTVHTIWTFKTPFIGAICNCDRDCLAYRLQVVGDYVKVYFKAEYVAQIDWDACNGCRRCMQYCQFGAVEYSTSLKRCYVNQSKCYGCGLCRVPCPQAAVTLRPRGELPGVRDWW